MSGFYRWAAVVGVLAGCGGAVPLSPEATPKTAGVSPAVMQAVRQATDRSQLQVDTVTLPSGERLKRASLGSGYQHVVLGRRNNDGSLSTACVNTAPGGEAFLTGTAGAGLQQ
jgi:hypothetical protein